MATSRSLVHNPFRVLGATPRDNRARLVELAEELALRGDEGAAQSARAQLSKPASRLKAEIAWLPGIAPARIEGLLELIDRRPDTIRSAQGLSELCLANLMAAAIERLPADIPPGDLSRWVSDLADVTDTIEPEDLRSQINEERRLSGFPEVTDGASVADALAERRRYYKDVCMAVLDAMPSRTVVDVVTSIIHEATGGGHAPAPGLVEELGDAYELKASAALQKGAAGIGGLAQRAATLGTNRPRLAACIEAIEMLTRQWDAVAQPIQLLRRSRGQEHEDSTRLAHELRALAVDLVNDHGLVAEGARLTKLLAEVFAELPEFVETVTTDQETLRRLASQRERSARERRQWEASITYSAEVGAFLERTLSISPDELTWGNKSFPLTAVTRVRWGATKHSVNGIPTGTTYRVAFGDDRDIAICNIGERKIWEDFTTRLWWAVGGRIAEAMVEELRNGGVLQIGDALVHDSGVTLPQRKLLGRSESVRCAWSNVHLWTGNGALYIGAKDNRRVYAELGYQTVDNVHVLEVLLETHLKTGHARISQSFD